MNKKTQFLNLSSPNACWLDHCLVFSVQQRNSMINGEIRTKHYELWHKRNAAYTRFSLNLSLLCLTVLQISFKLILSQKVIIPSFTDSNFIAISQLFPYNFFFFMCLGLRSWPSRRVNTDLTGFVFLENECHMCRNSRVTAQQNS